MSYLLDIFNKRQPAPEVSAPQQWNRPMTMPSGGPNTGTPMPFLNQNVQGESAPQPAQFRHLHQAAGIQPPSMMSQLNAQNSPPPGLAAMFSGGATPPPMGAGPSWASMTGNMSGAGIGGGMAPSMPNAVDQGLGMQQMNFGNPMGGMNNWFSNFTAPRPMPAPAAPAPMMPMKGMFGVR